MIQWKGKGRGVQGWKTEGEGRKDKEVRSMKGFKGKAWPSTGNKRKKRGGERKVERMRGGLMIE